MKPTKLSQAEQKAAELLLKQAGIAIDKLKTAADLAANVVASAKESTDRDFALAQQISELKGVVITGFDGVNKHLGTLNGQVVDHSKIINKILASDSFKEGEKQSTSNFWKNIVIVLTLLISIVSVYVAWKVGILYTITK
jgi:hypothetical protein